jgi:hypothetical protein
MQYLEFPAVDCDTVTFPPEGDENMPKDSPKAQSVPWATIFTTAIFVGGFLWAAHFEIGRIDDRIANLDKHISRLETAIRIVGAKQGADTKTLVDESLTAAKNAYDAGHVNRAVATLTATGNILHNETPTTGTTLEVRELAQKSLELTKTEDRNLSQAAWQITNAMLSSYSATFPMPSLDETKLVHLSYVDPKTECLVTKGARNTGVRDFLFTNCTLHLDDLFGPDAIARQLSISNTIFKNVTVVYSGGPLLMRGIYFENCTFQLEPSKGSEAIAKQLLAQSQPFNLYSSGMNR